MNLRMRFLACCTSKDVAITPEAAAVEIGVKVKAMAIGTVGTTVASTTDLRSACKTWRNHWEQHPPLLPLPHPLLQWQSAPPLARHQ
jgi:hypothetical protein